MQKMFIASDHAAFEAKSELISFLKDKFEMIDLGTHSKDSVSYSEYGQKLAQEVLENKALGIALCGSGIGISIAVNRLKGIRGALCSDIDDARLAKEHNNANVICFGARKSSVEDMKKMLSAWLDAEFEGGRHQGRIETLDK